MQQTAHFFLKPFFLFLFFFFVQKWASCKFLYEMSIKYIIIFYCHHEKTCSYKVEKGMLYNVQRYFTMMEYIRYRYTRVTIFYTVMPDENWHGFRLDV